MAFTLTGSGSWNDPDDPNGGTFLAGRVIESSGPSVHHVADPTIPEPASILLITSGMLMLGGWRLRLRRNAPRKLPD
jgi:hypothetical protein